VKREKKGEKKSVRRRLAHTKTRVGKRDFFSTRNLLMATTLGHWLRYMKEGSNVKTEHEADARPSYESRATRNVSTMSKMKRRADQKRNWTRNGRMK
jgi:hypothetical protein